MAAFHMKPMPLLARLEDLLRRGLDFYALNNAEEAIRCWEEAAKLDPSDARAAEYLAALGGDPRAPSAPDPAPAPPAPPEPERLERRTTIPGLRQVVDELGTSEGGVPRSFDRAQFVELLRSKRYEEALDALYQMHHAAPDNASVSRGIQVLKEKLLGDYLAYLGNLDLVVVPERDARTPGLSADEAGVLKLSDGIATLGDVLSTSRLGRFSTARALCGLVKRGAVSLEERAAPPVPPQGQEPPLPVVPLVQLPASTPEGRYDELFRRATEAYLRRDVDAAVALFTECLELRPDDRRVQHNIERLEARKRKS